MIITNLKGNSNSNVLLMTEDGCNFVRKTGDIQRNLDRYKNLDLPFPKVLRVEDNYYDIEYVKNINIANYLKHNSPNLLITFLSDTLKYLSFPLVTKNYTSVYEKKLTGIDLSCFKFNQAQLIDKLPKELPSSRYFGDLTFDNILFDIEKNRFVLIDGLSSEYDSYIFDLHKLKQDVLCKWFLRTEKNTFYLDYKLSIINNFLRQNYTFYDNNYLTILMLLRVFPYCKNEFDRLFLVEEINKLWM